jgi:Fe-S-cluster containining protein
MNSKQKVGRNDPCPCGSGKKYKHCCGDFFQTGISFYHKEKAAFPPDPNQIALHKAMAYVGKTGRMRMEFCRQYVARKQAVFKLMGKDLLEKTAAQGEQITCREGCTFCCTQYISGTLHEAEAIVHYLYQNGPGLDTFIDSHRTWWTKIKTNDAVFNGLENCFGELVSAGETPARRLAYQEANSRYVAQNIPCPFLNQGLCSIYEVRPFCCASVVATTPGKNCQAGSVEKPRVYVSSLRPKEVPFFRQTTDLVIVNIPLAVYELLNGGYGWLSGISGLEGLENEVSNDPEVRALLENRGKD